MKAISIRQPWAWLIINAGKDIENRDWLTNFRGRILVHASLGMTRAEYGDAYSTARMASGHDLPPMADLQRGGIIGSVEIVDCVKASTSPWFFGTFGFVLANPRPLPFVPFKGSLGFFDVPDHLVQGAA